MQAELGIKSLLELILDVLWQVELFWGADGDLLEFFQVLLNDLFICRLVYGWVICASFYIAWVLIAKILDFYVGR